jgi:hypothetical protein
MGPDFRTVTRSTAKNLRILAGTMFAVGVLSYLYLAVAGFNDPHLRTVLRLTARLSFMLFLVVFIARPLRQLWPGPATAWLLRERRSVGIAFAAAHTVHLALIACRYASFPALEYPLSRAAVGGLTYTLIYLMLLTSFDGPARVLGPRAWRILHKTGLYVIGFVFVSTLLPQTGEPLLTLDRAWFLTLTSGAIIIRLTAWLARRKPVPS